MTIYIDTSVVVSAFTNEVDTLRARASLREPNSRPYLISWWVEAEIAAAVHAKVVRGFLTAVQGEKLTSAMRAFIDESVVCVPVEHRHFIAAADFSRRASGLRAGDALHLAIAAAHEAAICTLDASMARAAEMLGLPVAAI